MQSVFLAKTTNANATTAKETIHSLVNSSEDVIQKKPPPPIPPPRQLQQKNTNIGSKFHVGRTTSNKAKYNHQRNSKQQKCNGLKDSGGDVVIVPNSSKNIKSTNTIPTTTNSTNSSSSSSNNAPQMSTQELCHSCRPAGDLTSELQCY